jgi:hypothetical protein
MSANFLLDHHARFLILLSEPHASPLTCMQADPFVYIVPQISLHLPASQTLTYQAL